MDNGREKLTKAQSCRENRKIHDGQDIRAQESERSWPAGNVTPIRAPSKPEGSDKALRYMEISHLYIGDYQIVSSLAQFESEAATVLEERAYLVDEILDRFARLEDTEAPSDEPAQVASYMANKLGMPEDNDHILGLRNFLVEREELIQQLLRAISSSLHPSGRS